MFFQGAQTPTREGHNSSPEPTPSPAIHISGSTLDYFNDMKTQYPVQVQTVNRMLLKYDKYSSGDYITLLVHL